MFKDKVYEEMDDVSKMFEPFQFNLNDELAQFPDKMEVDSKHLMSNDYWGSYGTDLPAVISDKAGKLKLTEIIKNMDLLTSHDFFAFEVEDLEDGGKITFDAGTMTLSHKLFLVKKKIAFDEQELEAMRKNMTINNLKRAFNRSRDVNKPRLNEVADIYNAGDVKSERSYRGKVTKFCEHLDKIIEDKTLDIRDMDLCMNFAKWIILYVKTGNLAALNNLTRIKIITHEKRPIYSIEEKEV